MLDPAEFRYSVADDGWVGHVGGTEFLLAGGVDGPTPEYLRLAESILPNLDAISQQAVLYLRRFLYPKGEWELGWVEIGWGETHSGREFELLLDLKEDVETDFGSYGVTFRISEQRDGLRFYPVEFRRRQN